MKIRTRRSLSFCGCGFLGIYYVGVAVCLRQHAPHLLLERIAGASAGSLAACCLICDLPLECMAGDFLRVVQEIQQHSLGAFSPWFNLPECLLEGMRSWLPENAHLLASGRLHISLTRVSDRRNVVMSEFSSRQELLQALMCSCFIPGVSGLVPPQIRGVRYMDGAFSNVLPLLDEHTVTVSPFCGESDICPRDQNPHLLQLSINFANTCIRLSRRNLRRMVGILVPGRADFMADFCQQGYDDTLQFLSRNSLLKEGFRIQEKGMISWIHQQMEREKGLRGSPRSLEKEHINSMTIKKEEKKDATNADHLTEMKEKRGEKRPLEEHDHDASSLMGSTWSLLRRVMVAPPLARHMVQVIVGQLSQSLTLCEQPHFDLPLMQAPTACYSSSTSCPPSTPMGDSDNDKVKA